MLPPLKPSVPHNRNLPTHIPRAVQAAFFRLGDQLGGAFGGVHHQLLLRGGPEL